MRTPIFWFLGWMAITVFVCNEWPGSLWISGFWIGWSMAIFGQDIADYLKRRTASRS